MKGRQDEGKTGVCSEKHPWKTRNVRERLGNLRTKLGEIKTKCRDWNEEEYENQVALWAGRLSEVWESIFSQEIVGRIISEGGLEVRPQMVKIMAKFSDKDYGEFNASYSRISGWAPRHNKSEIVNYVAPTISQLDQELELVTKWFKRVKKYQN